MPIRIALAACAALAVIAAGSAALAAAPVTRSDQALLSAVFVRAPRAAAPAAAPETASRSDPPSAGERRRIEAIEAGERARSDVTALSPGTAMHAGFHVKF